MAAFLVFCCHAAVLSYFRASTQTHLTQYSDVAGWIGVEFFFVLSGFVLTWSARPGDRDLLFWRRRLVKVYPNYLVVWVGAIGLATWAGQAAYYPVRDLWPSLVLLHTWVPNITAITSDNPVTWSLCCEAFFYLVFPFVYRLFRRIPANQLWWWAIGVTGAIFGVAAIATLMTKTPLMNGQNVSDIQMWFLGWFPPVRLLDFALGMLMAFIVKANRWPRLGIAPALVILAAGVTVQLLVWSGVWGLEAPVALPLALLIASAAAADSSARPSPFRARWLVWLGGISYAFYLTHFLILYYGHIPLGPAESWPLPAAIPILVGMLGVVIVVAWLVTRLVEEPMMERWARPRPKLPAQHEAMVSAPESAPDSAT